MENILENFRIPGTKLKLILTAALLIIFSLTAEAGIKYTNFMLSGGFSINGNIHSADFTSLPGFNTCCPKFTGGFGPGYSIFAGGEFKFDNHFIGSKWTYNFLLSFMDISAELQEDEFIGHVIAGNTYSDGISQHTIDPNLKMIGIDQGLTFYPVRDFPIGIRPGVFLGFIISKSFVQNEKLTSPSGAVFENGKNVRNEHSGDLPSAATAYFAASLALRYNSIEMGRFLITPQLQFNYGLSNFVSEINWSANTINLGVAFNYRIAKSVPPPPPPPPPAPLPEPPAPVVFAFETDVYSGGEKIPDGSDIILPYKYYEKSDSYMVRPVLFFAENETKASATGKVPENWEEAQKNVLNNIISYLKAHPDVNINIVAYAIDDEKPATAEKRAENAVKLLTSNGISKNRITDSTNTESVSDFKYEALAEEHRALIFDFSDGTKMLESQGQKIVNKGYMPVDINIETKIKSGSKPKSIDGQVKFDGSTIGTFDKNDYTFNLGGSPAIDELSPADLQGKELLVSVNITDIQGARHSSTEKFRIKPVVYEKKMEENLVKNNGKDAAQYILGFFDFDQADFAAVNKEIIEKIKKAVDNGKDVELLPLTDNTGSTIHNLALAGERANAALRLLGKYAEKVVVKYPDKPVFANDTPYGRVLNRSVVVRIR